MKVLAFFLFSFLSLAYATDVKTAFIKIGTYSGTYADQTSYTKNFFIPRYYRGSWILAKIYCQAYGFDLASLESQAEYTALRGFAISNKEYLTAFNHIDGVTPVKNRIDKTEWYRTNGAKFSFPLTWTAGNPSGVEPCLSLEKGLDFTVNDVLCHNSWLTESFFCEQVL